MTAAELFKERLTKKLQKKESKFFNGDDSYLSKYINLRVIYYLENINTYIYFFLFIFYQGKSQKCRPGWIEFKDRCYFFSTDKKSWQAAEVKF